MALEIEKRAANERAQTTIEQFKKDKDAEVAKAKKDYAGPTLIYYSAPTHGPLQHSQTSS